MDLNEMFKNEDNHCKKDNDSKIYENKLDKIINIYAYISIAISFIMIVCAISFIDSYKYDVLVIPLIITSILNFLSILFLYYFVKVFINISDKLTDLNNKIK
jgi:hypothetical protein